MKKVNSQFSIFIDHRKIVIETKYVEKNQTANIGTISTANYKIITRYWTKQLAKKELCDKSIKQLL